MKTPQFLEPEPSGRDELTRHSVSELIARAGVDHSTAARLADLLLAAAGCEDAVPGDLEHIATCLGGEARRVPSRQHELGAASWLLTVPGIAVWPPDEHRLERVCAHLAVADDQTAGLLRLIDAVPEAAAELSRSGLPAALLRAGALDPRTAIDVERVRADTKGLPGHPWNQDKRNRDPRLPDYWIALDPPLAFRSFEAMLRAEPGESLGAFASGLARAIDLRAERALDPLLAPSAEILCERRRDEKREDDAMLTRQCWEYLRWAFAADPAMLPEHRRSLRALAFAELGKMRGLVRGSDAERYAARQDYLNAALFFVLRTDAACESSLWDAMRRLLLALREQSQISAPPDLRAHDDGKPDFPRPWGWIPDRLMLILEILLGRERQLDDQLQRLRAKLAQHCLDRLKSRSRLPPGATTAVTDDLLEPDPTWRRGYLLALRQLGVNPGGRGHHVLLWSKKHDPDPEVRRLAEQAYEALRHGDGLPEAVSPRQAVFAACWYLRQAHVLALGGEIHEASARVNYRKEVRRAGDLDAES